MLDSILIQIQIFFYDFSEAFDIKNNIFLNSIICNTFAYLHTIFKGHLVI